MSVPNTTGAVRYTGNSATSTYSVTYYFQDEDDLEVSVTTTADVTTVLTKTTHYTVTGEGDQAGGSITLLSPYANLTTGYILTIRLKPALNNSDSYKNAGRLSLKSLEDSLDRMSQRIIRIQDEVDRSIKLPVHEAGASATTQLGDAAARASKYVGFDSAGNTTLTSSVSAGNLTVSAFGETLLDDSNAGAALNTLGVTAFVQTTFDDTNATVFRSTIGLDGASGVLVAGDFASNSVTTAKILDANVTAAKLASSAIAQVFQARLTLTSATPVTTSDVTAAGTIYLTPFRGNKIALYNGTIWKLHELTEISLALTATSGKNYDVWVYDNSGTLTLETTEWTNDTTRATALATQDGVYCKTGALTRRYVGTIRASGSNITEDSFAKRYVWNYYNRIKKAMKAYDATLTWNYTNTTVRQANGSSANQIDFVRGVNEDPVEARLLAGSSNATAGVLRVATLQIDATNTVSAAGLTGASMQVIANGNMEFAPASNTTVQHHCHTFGFPSAGRHFIAWVESSVATGTTAWYSADGSGAGSGGIIGSVFC
jgi:hypothetical protein